MVCQIHQHLGGAKSGGWTWPIKIQRLILDKKTSLFNIYDTKKLFVLHLRENTKALLIRRWKTFLRLKPAKYNSYVPKVMPDFVYKFTIYSCIHKMKMTLCWPSLPTEL